MAKIGNTQEMVDKVEKRVDTLTETVQNVVNTVERKAEMQDVSGGKSR